LSYLGGRYVYIIANGKKLSTFFLFYPFRGEKTAENELVGIMYWCQTSNEQVKISEEHSDFVWATVKEALQMVVKPSMQADIKAFLREKTASVK